MVTTQISNAAIAEMLREEKCSSNTLGAWCPREKWDFLVQSVGKREGWMVSMAACLVRSVRWLTLRVLPPERVGRFFVPRIIDEWDILTRMNIWKEGKYFDMWSIGHLLSGMVYLGWMIRFGFDLRFIFLSYIAIAILWEFFEVAKGVREYKQNRVLDVVKGMIGCGIMLVLLDANKQVDTTLLISITIVFAALEVWGYIAYKRRDI